MTNLGRYFNPYLAGNFFSLIQLSLIHSIYGYTQRNKRIDILDFLMILSVTGLMQELLVQWLNICSRVFHRYASNF